MAGTALRQSSRLIRENEPMSRHTSWRVGGPAERFFQPESVEELARVLAELDADIPVHWVGLGSNLLVRDGGLKGLVIVTHRALRSIERIDAESVRVEAGVHCARLAKRCVTWQLGSAEFFAGIPGTFGGALAMNAGAFGGETWDHVVEVEVIDRRGHRRRRGRQEYRVGYRNVAGPSGEWFLAAQLRLGHDPGASTTAIRELLARRKATQPIGQWSCGSVFRNPPDDHAARLIESAGLKGHRIGGARVSEKHANFIINDGSATAADIETLIDYISDTVSRVHGVRLEPEVRIVGEPR